MLTCLICQKPVRQQQSFIDFFLLKQDKPTSCQSCLTNFQAIGKQYCLHCYKPGRQRKCADCLSWIRKGYEPDHLSLYTYNEEMKEYFRRYKFQGDYRLRFIFAQVLKEALTSYGKDYQLIPIPISPKRFIERGFNQVSGLLEAAGLPFTEVLGKEETERQSAKTRADRLKRDQPFYVREEFALGSKLLLVDDIYTTGSTLHLARNCLLEKQSCQIKTFSLAR